MCVNIHEIIVKMMLKMKNRSHRHNINSPRSRHTVSIRIVSVWWCLYVCIKQHLSGTWSSVHEKVKQHWGWAEKSVAYKKSIYFVGTSNEPSSSRCERVLNLFYCSVLNLKLFLRESWKNQFFSPRFRGFWNCDLRTDLFNGFL